MILHHAFFVSSSFPVRCTQTPNELGLQCVYDGQKLFINKSFSSLACLSPFSACHKPYFYFYPISLLLSVTHTVAVLKKFYFYHHAESCVLKASSEWLNDALYCYMSFLMATVVVYSISS